MTRPNIHEQLADVASRCTGRISVCARHLHTGEEIALDSLNVIPTASVIKVGILLETLRQDADGVLSLRDRISLLPEDWGPGTGILKAFDDGLVPTLRDLAITMIALSDNTATNALLRILGGVDPVNAAMRNIGLKQTILKTRVEFAKIGDDVRNFAVSTTSELCQLMEAIAKRTAISFAVSEAAESILDQAQYRDHVGRYFDTNPYWRELGSDQPSVQFACKTGIYTGVWADAGIVRFAGSGFSYGVSIYDCDDLSLAPESEGAVLCGLIGVALLRYWWPESEGPAPVLAAADLRAARRDA